MEQQCDLFITSMLWWLIALNGGVAVWNLGMAYRARAVLLNAHRILRQAKSDVKLAAK
jgi:hypothetical protein